MTWSKIASTKYRGAAGGTTASINTTGANVLCAEVNWYAIASQPVLTDSKGNTWTAKTARTQAAGCGRMYYCLNPIVGSGHTFTLAPPGGGSLNSVSVYILALQGSAAGSVGFDVGKESGATQTSGTSIQPGSLTPSANNAVMVTGVQEGGTGALSINSSFTAEETDTLQVSDHFGGGIAWKAKPTAGAENPTWSWSSNTNGDANVTMLVFLEGIVTPLALTEFRTNEVIPLDGSNAYSDVLFPFVYDVSQTAPSSAKLQIYGSDGTTILQAYFSPQVAPTISGGTGNGGKWRIPKGGPYRFRIKTLDGGGSTIEEGSVTSITIGGAGYHISPIGQSNNQRMEDDASSPPAAVAGSWVMDKDGVFTQPAGNGNRVMLGVLVNALAGTGLAGTNVPFCVDRTAIGGAGWDVSGGTTGNYYIAGGFWNDNSTPGQPLQKAKILWGLIRDNKPPNFLFFEGGEADCEDGGRTYAQMVAAMQSIRSLINSFLGVSASQLPIIMGCIGRVVPGSGSTQDPHWSDGRKADLAFLAAETNVWPGATITDLPYQDNYHPVIGATGFERLGRRWAQSILSYLGAVSTDGMICQIASALYSGSGNDVYVTLNSPGAAALKNTSGSGTAGTLTGWEYSKDDFSSTETISAYAFASGQVGQTGKLQVKLTLSSTPARGDKIRYFYGRNPTITNLVFDDTAPGSDSQGRPLLPTGNDIVVALYTPVTVAASCTPSPTVNRATGRTVATTTTMAAAVLRTCAKSVAGSVTPSGAVAAVKGVGVAIAAACTPSPEIARATSKTVAGATAPAPSVAAIKVILRTVAASCTPVAAIALNVVGAVFHAGRRLVTLAKRKIIKP